MQSEDSAPDEKDFNFEAWAARPIKPSFEVCVKSALESLALSDKNLRDRLRSALFCLLYVDPSQVPLQLQPAYGEVERYVAERLGFDRSVAAFGRLTRKLKLRTAKRLSRQIIELYEQAVGRKPP
jgi:hypothetical protein